MGADTPTNGKPIASGDEKVTLSPAEVIDTKHVVGPGVVILVLSWIITLYTLWQMVEMHEMVPGKRFDRYHELGQHAFGEKLGLWIVVPQQLICEVGVDIVYMVTGGKSLQKIHDLVCHQNCKQMKTTYFIMIFASVHFVLSHLPNFNTISGISLAAAIMSLR
ncbi:Lysine histidine transporter 2 [Spatholobus suberectus]|nr:Lysine histidine transporter 2 [Spatholobus suberectus]